MQYKKDYKGIPFSNFVQSYGKRSDAFAIKGYKVPKKAHPTTALSAVHVLKYP
jgi:hypothetical protein